VRTRSASGPSSPCSVTPLVEVVLM
jgi:hypothetical protein